MILALKFPTSSPATWQCHHNDCKLMLKHLESREFSGRQISREKSVPHTRSLTFLKQKEITTTIIQRYVVACQLSRFLPEDCAHVPWLHMSFLFPWWWWSLTFYSLEEIHEILATIFASFKQCYWSSQIYLKKTNAHLSFMDYYQIYIYIYNTRIYIYNHYIVILVISWYLYTTWHSICYHQPLSHLTLDGRPLDSTCAVQLCFAASAWSWPRGMRSGMSWSAISPDPNGIPHEYPMRW